LRSAYAACAVFVLPSTLETPGLAALEAAAAGARLVVTSEGSTREYFGDEVFYADPQDDAAIAGAIAAALGAPRRAGLAGRIVAQYRWDRVVLELERVYRHAIAESRGAAARERACQP